MKDQDTEFVHFVFEGVNSESRPAYASMRKERYNRIMPPFLMDAEEVAGTGNGDERCYQEGHAWTDERPHLGHARNGTEKECLVCGQQAIRRWSRQNEF